MLPNQTPATPQLQTERLNKLGWAVADIPFYRLADTLSRFQYAHLDRSGRQLEIDGEYGPLTHDALFNVYPIPFANFAERVLAVAASQIGVSEVPPGSNKGPQIDIVLKSVGLGPGYAWCAAYVHWCMEQASRQLGIANPCPPQAGVLNLWDLAGYPSSGLKRITAAQAAANPALIKPGMQFILNLGGRAGHTGLIERVGAGGQLVTLEGNTNQALSREGVGVFRLNRRTIKSINQGFIAYV